jgi:site-specific recombinase XerD
LITRHNPLLLFLWEFNHEKGEDYMTEQFFVDPKVRQRLHRGPLGTHLNGFAEALFEQGYAATTTKQKLLLISEMSHWLQRRRLTVEDVSDSKVETFGRYRKRKACLRRGDILTLRQFLNFLRQAGLIPTLVPEIEDSPVQRIEKNYAHYLSQERGLSQLTLDNYLPIVRQFLTWQFGDGEVILGKLSPQHISGFILRYAHKLSPGRAQLMVTVLRSFLRFLHQEGQIDTNLATAVPTVAKWRFTELPKFLKPEEAERLLQSCDQNTVIGKRDYAVLLLLSRLGLRAGEVVHMNLDDIHWEAGELLVRGKSSREERLPLPQDIGEALAAYLRHGRPRCSSRRVFIRMDAPRQGFSGSAAVCDIVRRALSRAGINPGFKGAHLLRHTLATTMLRGGASFPEIGEILRHQLPSTTEIYAKVDLSALRSIARPWPGGVACVK